MSATWKKEEKQTLSQTEMKQGFLQSIRTETVDLQKEIN